MISLDDKIHFLKDKATRESVQMWLDVKGCSYSLAEKMKLFDLAESLIDVELGKCKSPIEKILYLVCVWAAASEPIVHPGSIKTQYEIGKYKADVYMEICGKKVVFEADGHDFHEKTKEQAKHDKERDRFMQSKGVSVYRFTGSEVYSNVFDVYIEIVNIIFSESNLALEDCEDE